MARMRAAQTRADARVLPIDTTGPLHERHHEQKEQCAEHDVNRTTDDPPSKLWVSPPPSINSVAALSTQLVWNRARLRQLQRREWTEQAVVLWDALQIYALVWQLAQPWPWPARWLRVTRWVNALNFDVFSFRATGAALGATSQPFSLWGEMHHYWLYALLWAALPSVGWVVLRAADAHWRRSGRADCLVATTRLELAMLQLFQRLYLPIGLAALRLTNCDANGVVSVDPRSIGACWSPQHALAVAAISIGLGGSFLLGLPWLLHVRISKYLPQPSAAKHERFVRSKELEFALGTSETFLELHIPLHASFARPAVEAPVEMCVLKLVLLLVFTLLRSPFPNRANEGLQGSLVVAAITVMAVRRATRASFRLRSTSRLALLVDGALVSNGVFVLLSANGVRSALTVATTLTRCLTAVNLVWVVLIALWVAQSAREWMVRARDVSVRALCCWSTNGASEHAEANAASVRTLPEHVETIKRTKAALLKALLATPSMRSTEDLGAVLQRLQECCDDAVRRDHLLADQLSELLLYANEIYVDAVATNPFHRLPFPESELVHLSHVLQKRADSQVLLSSRSRRVLSKMQAASAWAPAAMLSRPAPSPPVVDQSVHDREDVLPDIQHLHTLTAPNEGRVGAADIAAVAEGVAHHHHADASA